MTIVLSYTNCRDVQQILDQEKQLREVEELKSKSDSISTHTYYAHQPSLCSPGADQEEEGAPAAAASSPNGLSWGQDSQGCGSGW